MPLNSFRRIIRRFVLSFYLRSRRTTVKELVPHVKRGDFVLDLGCGTGALAFLLGKKAGVRVVGIDIRDTREFDIPFTVYDGRKLPFQDGSFDVVLISYVLHHTANAEEVLSEAKRVCRGKIIIYEDTPANLFHRISCYLHGRAFNRFYGLRSGCTFRDVSEWLTLFRDHNLQLIDAEEAQHFNPIHHTRRTRFILEATGR